MADRTGSWARARVGWAAALVAVPVALAGLSLLCPGPGIADDLGSRSRTALVVSGLAGVTVAVDGRDVQLDGVPRGSERLALEAVSAVTGVRAARLGGVVEPVPAEGAQQGVAVTGAGPTGAPSMSAGTGIPPTAAGPATPPDGSAVRRDELLAAIEEAGPVTFAADSAVLAGPSAAAVAVVARALLAAPEVPVEITGYVADTPGSAEVAQDLSVRRAEVVADALVRAGIDRALITATGRGATRPLSTLAASRRAEISIP